MITAARLVYRLHPPPAPPPSYHYDNIHVTETTIYWSLTKLLKSRLHNLPHSEATPTQPVTINA